MPRDTGLEQRHMRDCKGGKCSCPWRVSIYSKRDGKRIRKTFTGKRAKSEAQAWRDDKLAAVRRGEVRAPTAMTVREAAEAFMAGAKDGSIPTASGDRYKPATLRGYRVALDKRLLPAFGGQRLSDIDREHVQDFANRLAAEGLSSSTVHNTLDPLRAIYRRARRTVPINPTKDLELRRPDGKRERIAEPEEAAALIAALPDDSRALWATAFYAGLRRGELRALRWSDIDLPGRVIHVSRGWDAIEGEQAPKSAAAKRRVPILDALTDVLIAHQARTGRAGDALVFGRTATAPFNPETVRRDALAAWGTLTPITLHEARHTCASLLIAAGVNPKALSVIMGHSTIAMTFDTYGHLMPGGLDEARAATDAYLAKLAGEPRLRLVS